MNIPRLIARTLIGGLFVGHGLQKLTGAFGGPGLQGTTGMMESLDMHPPRRNALAAGVAETGGGALLFAGIATPLASATLIGTMITAIRKVHWPSGPWVSSGGYEYNLVLIAALLALAEDKPGDISLDAALGWEFRGLEWPLAALVAGAAASELTVWMGRRAGEQEDAQPSPETAPEALS